MCLPLKSTPPTVYLSLFVSRFVSLCALVRFLFGFANGSFGRWESDAGKQLHICEFLKWFFLLGFCNLIRSCNLSECEYDSEMNNQLFAKLTFRFTSLAYRTLRYFHFPVESLGLFLRPNLDLVLTVSYLPVDTEMRDCKCESLVIEVINLFNVKKEK